MRERVTVPLLILLVLAACTPTPTAVPQPPTAVPATATAVPQQIIVTITPDSPEINESQPPTWTQPPRVIPATRTPRPSITPRPPTVTPAISPTRSLRDGPPTPVIATTFEPECVGFAPYSTPPYKSIIKDTEVLIGWFTLPTAEYYEVWLKAPDDRYVLREYVTVTDPQAVFAFTADLFKQPGAYQWEVLPMKNKDRMCGSINGQIEVRD